MSIHPMKNLQVTQLMWLKNKKNNKQSQLTQCYHLGPLLQTIPPKNVLYWVLPYPKPFKNPGNSRQRAVNDSGKMAMCQGCAERQCGGVRGCLRKVSVAVHGRHRGIEGQAS